MKKLMVACLLFISACKQKQTMFTQVGSSHSKITFNNKVIENDSINPIDMEFLYNGGGVSVADFNNDNLPDLYFTGSQVSNKLYLNKGDFVFEDVTETAGVTGGGMWSNAASVVDINNDGLQDIYVCTSIKKNANQRRNIFYINQGIGEKGVPVFKDMASAYGLADTSLSVHAAFFDYDNDGDLDVYVVNTKLAQRNSTRFDGGNNEITSSITDKLYRNDGVMGNSKHPVFTDVSMAAGIKDDGYGLGIAITDLNNDGWKDIYVTNDFFGSDLLYINQRNGTFSNKAMAVMKHTSQSAMGNDIADINNDGLPDILAVDMDPEDNYRKKKNMGGNNYFFYQSMNAVGLVFQYARNTLQLNNGVIQKDTGMPLPVFSDISFHAGIAETDWSWSVLAADFDNDGNKDIFITNGYPKDVTDQDFAFFNANAGNTVSKQDLLSRIPQIKVSNYAFRNTGTLKFENITEQWGIKLVSFSNGAAYVDLDNDGDLDYVVNNINDEAFVYKNNAEKFAANNFINIKFKGGTQNVNGLGAIAELHRGNTVQVFENSPYRGYLSSVDPTLHFGLGENKNIDSIVIKWNNGMQQTILHPEINKTLSVDISEAKQQIDHIAPGTKSIFTDVTHKTVRYQHTEFDYIDFDIQHLLPHKLSEYNPCLAAGDVDGNGLDDLFIGASVHNESYFFLQQKDGSFVKKELPPLTGARAPKPELTGALLFDADADGDLDLYSASGSNEFAVNHAFYQDRFFINDGKGNFLYDSTALPSNRSSKSCVKAADYDGDGDLDLFIGSRLIPQKYPAAASSILLRNDSEKGRIKFTDVTKELAPGLTDAGLVCDASWSDYDNDGWPDLIVSGEWMPVSFFHNEKGKLVNATASTGLKDKIGWWTSITSGDFDNDGDIDYIAGNLGENSFYRGDSVHPATIYAGDFLKNKTYVVVPSVYLPDVNGMKDEFPAHSRNDIVNQLPAMKKKFLSYKSFAEANIHTLFDEKDLKQAYSLKANYFKSVYIENKGQGHFIFRPLPEMAQLAPINGMVTDDINHDGFLDVLLVGNDFGTEVSTGRYDAMNGSILWGDGKGNFKAATLEETGFYVPGNAKSLVKLRSSKNEYMLAASQNRDSLRVFKERNNDGQLIPLMAGDKNIFYTMANGQTRKEEVYYGNSFLSQSSNFIYANDKMVKIVVEGKSGKREVKFK